ncbi:hypothetical protein PIB30_052064 [Stylosanthes scabra]|uniref:Uncharacterized protein n=1 Tax=Stylosanthes scabra TaxID=79078 RepID=A0ABU6WJQ8_9FABA|nr:hypothetical protein [Stylosanthes scabra]
MTSRRRRIPAMISKEKRMNGGDDLQGEEENVADDACRKCDDESKSMVVWVVLIRGGGYGNSQRLKEDALFLLANEAAAARHSI